MTSLSRLSKLLSLLLRHRPEEAGLELDARGFAPLADVLMAVQERFPEVGEEDIHRIVEDSRQQRFEITERGIRALYGHSFFVEMEEAMAQVPEVLYLGCLRREVARFRSEGIKPVDRYYVHLSLSRQVAQERSRQPGDPCVVEVLGAKAREAGIEFYQRGEVVLTREVPPQFVGQAHGFAERVGAEREGERPAAPEEAPQGISYGRRPRKATGRR